MAKTRQTNMIGSWAFLIGVILAIILGAFGSLTSTWLFVLVIIGLVIGFLNIAEEEVGSFLMSGAVLIIASGLGKDVMSINPILNGVLGALLGIFVPATIIVAIKHVFSLARH